MSNPTTPRSRYRMAVSATFIESVDVRMAVTRARMVNPVPSEPSAKPARIASTTSSRDRPPAVCRAGAKRTSAYTQPSPARSTAHSNATLWQAAAVCITPTVCSKVSR